MRTKIELDVTRKWEVDDPISKNPQRAIGGERIYKVVGAGFGGGLVADFSAWWTDPRTALQNATLGAAAPELYSALAAMLDFYAADCEPGCKVDDHGPAGDAAALLERVASAVNAVQVQS